MHENLVCLGRIVRAHGIRGVLLLKLDNPQSNSLRSGLEVILESPTGAITKGTVDEFLSGRFLTLVDLCDRTAAEKLAKHLVYVNRKDLPKVDDDEIYLLDMIGFEVIDETGKKIGEVESFSDNLAQVLIGVRTIDGILGFVPYVKPLIKRIDQESRKIVVDLPHGLFEDDKTR